MRSNSVLLRLDDDELARAERLAKKRKIDTLQVYLRTLIDEDAEASGARTSEEGPERRSRCPDEETVKRNSRICAMAKNGKATGEIAEAFGVSRLVVLRAVREGRKER